MSSVLKWVVATAGLALVAAVPVQAQTAGGYLLTDTSPITIQGWTITLSKCSASGTTTCAGSEVIPTVANTSLGITLSMVFQNVSPSDPLLSNLSVATGSDLSFANGITVQAPTGLKIYESQIDIRGTDATQPTRVTATEVVVDAGTIERGLQTDLSKSPTLQSQIFTTPNNSVTGNTDFRAGSSVFTDPATMNTATLKFVAAPEPVSASLLAVGIAGLGFVRRKFRRVS
ncbi:MAG: hypothetical protein QOD93_2633 [Acetobacteraceae bacterium]|jgi:hypothetical protein|nr:hypothetical protein [Acetobacteraceae bacterium]